MNRCDESRTVAMPHDMNSFLRAVSADWNVPVSLLVRDAVALWAQINFGAELKDPA